MVTQINLLNISIGDIFEKVGLPCFFEYGVVACSKVVGARSMEVKAREE